MGGFDDHVAIMGDWMPPSPSPLAFSSMMNDDVAAWPITGTDSGNICASFFPWPEQHVAMGNPDHKDQTEARVGGDETGNSNGMGEPKLSSRGGLMERIAARAGFNAPRLNTESIRPPNLSKKLEVHSPHLTIPPGLSPTTLLDSPVFLSNSLVQQSPTTGKFLCVTSDLDKRKESNFEGINASSFAFKLIPESSSFPYFNAANKSFSTFGVSVLSNTSVPCQSTEPPKVDPVNNDVLFQEGNFGKPHAGKSGSSNLLPEQTNNSFGGVECSPPFDEHHEDGDQRSGGDPNSGGSTAEDGYNWRKYGQKHVKGSEYPRSYYKCTHPNCPVKKKVERSLEGHITEIIYKGAHNHPKPPPSRSLNIGPPIGDMELDSEQQGTGATSEPIFSAMQSGNVGVGWKPDNLESTSSAQLGQELCNGGTMQSQSGGQFESMDGVDGSSISHDEDDDHVTHGSVSLGYDGEGDELESKRRRIEAYAQDMSGPTRAIREPRVVVQTTSEVDILDDGYRWRKYGQKVVKGNPNPRSYYKCTSAGCNVRKHVERASHDLKSVITTYEGKHKHDVPAARNSAHVNSVGPITHTSQQPPSAINHRQEPSQIRGRAAWFERPSMGSFALPLGRQQLGPGPGYGFGMNQAGLASMGLAGLCPNQGKLPMLPVHSYLGPRARPVNDTGYMLPKGEPKQEPVSDPGLNPSIASTVYQQFMSRMPLGPQM